MRELQTNTKYTGKIKKYVVQRNTVAFLVIDIKDEHNNSINHMWVKHIKKRYINDMFTSMRSNTTVCFSGTTKTYVRKNGTTDRELIVDYVH